MKARTLPFRTVLSSGARHQRVRGPQRTSRWDWPLERRDLLNCPLTEKGEERKARSRVCAGELGRKKDDSWEACRQSMAGFGVEARQAMSGERAADGIRTMERVRRGQ